MAHTPSSLLSKANGIAQFPVAHSRLVLSCEIPLLGKKGGGEGKSSNRIYGTSAAAKVLILVSPLTWVGKNAGGGAMTGVSENPCSPFSATACMFFVLHYPSTSGSTGDFFFLDGMERNGSRWKGFSSNAQ
jgi:hypothetical protein